MKGNFSILIAEQAFGGCQERKILLQADKTFKLRLTSFFRVASSSSSLIDFVRDYGGFLL